MVKWPMILSQNFGKGNISKAIPHQGLNYPGSYFDQGLTHPSQVLASTTINEMTHSMISSPPVSLHRLIAKSNLGTGSYDDVQCLKSIWTNDIHWIHKCGIWAMYANWVTHPLQDWCGIHVKLFHSGLKKWLMSIISVKRVLHDMEFSSCVRRSCEILWITGRVWNLIPCSTFSMSRSGTFLLFRLIVVSVVSASSSSHNTYQSVVVTIEGTLI